MDQITRNTMQQIMSQFKTWVKSFTQESAGLRTPEDAVSFEKRFRDEGLRMIGSVFEHLLQMAKRQGVEPHPVGHESDRQVQRHLPAQSGQLV